MLVSKTTDSVIVCCCPHVWWLNGDLTFVVDGHAYKFRRHLHLFVNGTCTAFQTAALRASERSRQRSCDVWNNRETFTHAAHISTMALVGPLLHSFDEVVHCVLGIVFHQLCPNAANVKSTPNQAHDKSGVRRITFGFTPSYCAWPRA